MSKTIYHAAVWILTIAVTTMNGCGEGGRSGGDISGEIQVWRTVSIDFHGPETSELDDSPNPFLSYRLNVAFTGPNGQGYMVPGYFDGDGAGGGTGDVWRVRFTPDEAGKWSYRASFRTGKEVAVSLDSGDGKPVGSPDGARGSFTVAGPDPDATGFAKWGRLEYAENFYLKFRDGPHWIKGGTDTPENFLDYSGFDNTTPNPERPEFFHTYERHTADWRPGDPDWGDGKGKGIIGLLNYLGSKKVNSIYILLMNVGGDGQDVWPWAGEIDRRGSPDNDNVHFDISKLAQWETVFAHAQRRGINLLFVLNEGEGANKRELDDSLLGTERKLYYREMIARFGHHNALQWMLCEEFNHNDLLLKPELGKAWAGYIKAVDPYDHPVGVHNMGEPIHFFSNFAGDDRFDMTSIQFHGEFGGRRYSRMVEAHRQLTMAAGRPLAIMVDEPIAVAAVDGEKHIAIDHGGWTQHAYGHGYIRKQVIYPVLFSGGSAEFILHGMLENDDLRPYDSAWDYLYYARKFMEENIPFWEMEPYDPLLSRSDEAHGDVLAVSGEIYAVHLPEVKSPWTLSLDAEPRDYSLRWYDPRTGRFAGETARLKDVSRIRLADPPGDRGEDWVALVRGE